MATTRGTSNSNERGSAAQRRVRKQWLLDTFGNGEHAYCCFLGCKEALTFDTITVDRHPLAGCEGGTYKRGNIRPMCGFHNSSTGAKLGHERKKAKANERITVQVFEDPQPLTELRGEVLVPEES